MAKKIIPVPGEGLQFIFDDAGLVHMKESVATYNDLPISGNTENDVRITRDTDHMYTWTIASSSGNLSDWLDIGPITSVDWSAITNKPTSSVADIDDAVAKKHTQNTDTGTDSTTFAIDDAKIKNESGNLAARNDTDDDYVKMRASDPVNDNDLVTKSWVENNFPTISDIVKNSDNIMINAFRIAINGALTIFNMIDGFVDEYEDESGVDTAASINESYDATDDFYKPTGGTPVSEDPYAHFKCNDDAANTTVTDDGTGSNDGIASTNTENLSVAGKINEAFDFNGTTEAISVDALEQDIDTDTTGTIAFWFYIDDLSNWPLLFSLNDTDGDAIYWLRATADGHILSTVDPGLSNKWSFTSTTTTLSTGIWYHLVLVQDGTEPKLYINNSEETLNFTTSTDKTAWFATIGANTDNGRIGCSNYNNEGNNRLLDGKIDDFRYYQNQALSSVDISAIYNGGNGTEDQNPTGPVDNMTLISENVSAEAEPDNSRIIILEEDVAPITLNTDLKAYASKDDGATWAQITLTDEGDYDTDKRILVGNADLSVSGIGDGTDMVYKLVTETNKMLKLHATALRWD